MESEAAGSGSREEYVEQADNPAKKAAEKISAGLIKI
jgi:hypothetical protein